MSSAQIMLAVIAVVVGSGGIGGTIGVVAVKRMNRTVDNATAEATTANAEATRVTARAREQRDDLEVLREVITEIRTSEAQKQVRIDDLAARVEKLEERERHMLTRAAVHEAWDQLAFQALVSQNAQYPPPPPLITREVMPPASDPAD